MKYHESDHHEDKDSHKMPLLACWHCKYFVHEDGDVLGDMRQGQCRRFPPRRMPSEDERDNRPGCAGDYEFPYVFSDAWCGEFQRKQFLPEWIDREGAKFRLATWECTTLFEPENDVVVIVFGDNPCYDFPAWYVCDLIASGDISPIDDRAQPQ